MDWREHVIQILCFTLQLLHFLLDVRTSDLTSQVQISECVYKCTQTPGQFLNTFCILRPKGEEPIHIACRVTELS